MIASGGARGPAWFPRQYRDRRPPWWESQAEAWSDTFARLDRVSAAADELMEMIRGGTIDLDRACQLRPELWEARPWLLPQNERKQVRLVLESLFEQLAS